MTIIITGKAGTGKTFLINNLFLPKSTICAMTGVAALHIKSKTLHQTLRLKGNISILKQLQNKKSILTNRTFIIDEASMLDRYDFLALKRWYPMANWILVGDWTQLPPVNGTLIQEKDADVVYELTAQKRSIDFELNEFLQNLQNGNINEVTKIIKNRLSRRAEKRAVSYKNNTKQLYNNLTHSQIRINDTLIFNNHYIKIIDGKKKDFHFYDEFESCPFINNCFYDVVETNNIETEQITLKVQNIITKEYHYVPEKFLAYFSVIDCMTAHKLQGTTLKEPLTVCLDDFIGLEPILLTKLLYVSCSRVTKLEDLSFLLTDSSLLNKLQILALKDEFLNKIAITQRELIENINSIIQKTKKVTFFATINRDKKCNLFHGDLKIIAKIFNLKYKTFLAKVSRTSKEEAIDYYMLKNDISQDEFETKLQNMKENNMETNQNKSSIYQESTQEYIERQEKLYNAKSQENLTTKSIFPVYTVTRIKSNGIDINPISDEEIKKLGIDNTKPFYKEINDVIFTTDPFSCVC